MSPSSHDSARHGGKKVTTSMACGYHRKRKVSQRFIPHLCKVHLIPRDGRSEQTLPWRAFGPNDVGVGFSIGNKIVLQDRNRQIALHRTNEPSSLWSSICVLRLIGEGAIAGSTPLASSATQPIGIQSMSHSCARFPQPPRKLTAGCTTTISTNRVTFRCQRIGN